MFFDFKRQINEKIVVLKLANKQYIGQGVTEEVFLLSGHGSR